MMAIVPQFFIKNVIIKKNAIVFFKTIKGAKFGAYTEVGFGLGGGVYIQYDEIFNFSINLSKIYNIKKRVQAIGRCKQNICGVDLEYDIYTSYNYFSGDNHHCYNDMKTNYEGLENSLEMNLGEKYFISSEVEVFQVVLY